MGVSFQRDPVDDPLAPSRGIVNGVLLSFLGWSPLFVVIGYFIVRS